MTRLNVLRRVIAGVGAAALLTAAVQFADAAAAFDYYYDDAGRFGLYGQQDNFSG
jgi:hypothetical protein